MLCNPKVSMLSIMLGYKTLNRVTPGLATVIILVCWGTLNSICCRDELLGKPRDILILFLEKEQDFLFCSICTVQIDMSLLLHLAKVLFMWSGGLQLNENTTEQIQLSLILVKRESSVKVCQTRYFT